MSVFAHAAFLRAAGRGSDLPPPGPPEIAFAGRSNVGKSINFYALAEAARLVDLPGYGYARVPQTLRRQWRELVGAYLRSAATLVGVVLLMDARHPLTPLDEQLIDWLGDARLLVLLTKADKLSRGAQQEVLAQVSQRLRRHEVTLFSSVTRHGVDQCRDLLEQWLRAGSENKRPPVKGI